MGQRMEYEVELEVSLKVDGGVSMAEDGIDVRRIAMEAADEVEGVEDQEGLGGGGVNGGVRQGEGEGRGEEEVVGVEDSDAPSTPTGVVGGEVERKERVYKKGPWSVPEMLALQLAKREDVVRAGKGLPREKHRTAQEKWQSIEDYCWVRLVQRSAQQCQDKWESMSAEFKKVKDFECGTLHGQKSYWLMTIDERKSVRVPPNFQKEVYSALWEWYDKNRVIEPEQGARPREAVSGTLHTPLQPARPRMIMFALPAPDAPPLCAFNSSRSLTVRIEYEAGAGTVLTTMSKTEDLRVHSPVAGGSSSPSGAQLQTRKRPVDRGVARVPRKLSRVEGVSVPTNLDPRLMTIAEREAYSIFELGNFVLREGATLRGAKLAYKTWGTMNEDRSNAIVYPSWFSGRHWENDWLIGPGMGLDPCKYFIIVPNMLGNGLSTSPSNCLSPYNKARFPKIRVEDNVRAQYKLVTEKFGIRRLKLVIGWCMGAGQAFQWATSFPDMVERILPFCGSARTSPHNIVFLEGVKAALTTDSLYQDGWYEKTPTKGLRAAARVYAGWGFSHTFYWNEVRNLNWLGHMRSPPAILYTRANMSSEVWREMGYSSLEDFLVGFWEGYFLDRRDPNNLLTMLWTWQNGNIGLTQGFEGSVEKALASIRAKAIVMPAQQDLYFPVSDEEYEVKFMQNAELRVIPGVWGHFAGAGLNAVDTKFIDNAVRDLLSM